MKFSSYFFSDFRKLSHLFHSHLGVLIILALSYLGTYGLNLYLANHLSPTGYGDVSVILQFLVFSAPLALMGTKESMLRFLPFYLSHHELDYFAGYIRWSLKIIVIASICILLGQGILIGGLSILEHFQISKIAEFRLLIYAIWLIPLFAILTWQATYLQALRKYYHSSIFQGFGVTFLIILTLIVFLSLFSRTWFGDYDKRFSVVLCIGIAYLIVIAIQSFFIWKWSPKTLFQVPPKYNKSLWKRTSYEMMPNSIVFATLLSIDIFMLDILGKDPAEVGHFTAIAVIASSIAIFNSAVSMIVNPLISPLIRKNEKEHLQSIVNLTNIISTVPGFLFLLVIILFGPWLLTHFGKGFPGAYPALVLLSAGFFVGNWYSGSGSMLLFSGHHIIDVKISISQLLFIILFDIILIPYFQIMGAVISVVLSILLSNLVKTYFVRKYLGIRVFFLY